VAMAVVSAAVKAVTTPAVTRRPRWLGRQVCRQHE
jgi:hypothetical protein